MTNLNTLNKLERAVERAAKREQHDDHLTDEERQVIVDAHRELVPELELPEDLTDAFVEVIWG